MLSDGGTRGLYVVCWSEAIRVKKQYISQITNSGLSCDCYMNDAPFSHSFAVYSHCVFVYEFKFYFFVK